MLVQLNENIFVDRTKVSAVHVGTHTDKETEETVTYIGAVVDGEMFSIVEFPGDPTKVEKEVLEELQRVLSIVDRPPFEDQVWDAIQALLPFGKAAHTALLSDDDELLSSLEVSRLLPLSDLYVALVPEEDR